MARRRRILSEEERDLWRRVTRDVETTQRPPAPTVVDEPAAAPQPIQPKPVIRRATRIVKPVGPTNPGVTTPAPPIPAPSGLDRKTEERLRKGRRTPDARLDLHGLSAARAHAALKIFIADSQAMGRRCVLVITGKGMDVDPGFGEVAPGVLRREAPRWLATPPLSHMIVNVSQAHAKHGGGGALYVYLKRKR